MYIKRIVLENIRGFKTLDFVFEPARDDVYSGWNVVTGDNASGKTTLLKAVSLALVGPEAARALQPSLDGWVRKGETVGRIAVQLLAGANDKFASGKRYQKPFWSELELTADAAGRITSFKPGHKFLGSGKGPTRGPWLERPDGWFCVAYGPFRRLSGHSPEAQRLMSAQGKIARFATLFREDATLAESDLWLRDLRYRQLSGDTEARERIHAVMRVIGADFLQHEIRIERVDPDGLWLRQRDGVTLSLKDMSDGYRSALAMLFDILRHVIDVYGLQGFQQTDDERYVIDNSGVIAIDEIDAHLHPSWQQLIGGWLKKMLPNMQFVVTTHSPIIAQESDHGALFRLPAPGSDEIPLKLDMYDYEAVVAGRADEVLRSPAFGLHHTRSLRAESARREFSQLKAKKLAGALSRQDEKRVEQLQLFVKDDFPDETD